MTPSLASHLELVAATLLETDAAAPGDVEKLFEQVQQLMQSLEAEGYCDAAERLRQCQSPIAGAKAAVGEIGALADTSGSDEQWQAISRELCALQAEVASDVNRPIAENGRQQDKAKRDDAPLEITADLADDALLSGFLSEAQEHLEAAEAQLLMLESEPGNLESLNAVFRAFHTIKGVANMLDLKAIGTVAHEAESLLDRARNNELRMSGAAIDAAFASCDALKQLVHGIAEGKPASSQSAERQFGPLLATLQQLSSQSEPANEPTNLPSQTEAAATPPATRAPAADETSSSPGAATNGGNDTLKVDRARLDRLIDMIGELVIAESMVHQDVMAAAGQHGLATRNLVKLNKITRHLQELSLSLRMVPVRGTFQKMARLARDLSKKINKPIDFHTSGEDTELDKTMVDQVGDPLMHMIRNALDHGIEANPEDRLAAGKPFRGQVALRAFHQGGNIYIEIEDDGRGLNRDKILAKARQRGLVSEDAVLSDREVFDLVFRPGFSTAEKVTDVSGRGVGMDVVKRNIEALRGSIELRSELGKGSCFSMRLPLTLAIIDGMVVRVGQNRYIIPTLSIVELLRPSLKDVCAIIGRGECLSVRQQQLPLVRIGSVLRVPGCRQQIDEAIVAVVEDDGTLSGLLVDEVLGQQQAVIKSLGARLENQPGLAGGAIMPDGSVGLLLDIHGLLELSRQQPGA
jgi:two-component system chemotaxis sensor kinase CheA